MISMRSASAARMRAKASLKAALKSCIVPFSSRRSLRRYVFYDDFSGFPEGNHIDARRLPQVGRRRSLYDLYNFMEIAAPAGA
jgi:hypothetical protein